MENIKELLLKECDYPLPDKIMESFLEPKSEIFLKRNEILVMGGMINTNIYVVEEGILRYRGYSIEELADKGNFLEVSYLVIFGELPTKDQLEKFGSRKEKTFAI